MHKYAELYRHTDILLIPLISLDSHEVRGAVRTASGSHELVEIDLAFPCHFSWGFRRTYLL